MNLARLTNTISTQVIGILAFAIFAVSCSNELSSFVEEEFPEGEVVSFTRSTDNQWTMADRVGIAAFNVSDNSAYTTGFRTYKPRNEGTHVRLLPDTNDDAIVLPDNGNTLYFVAFAPYQEVTDNTANFDLADQSGEGTMETLDLIYYKETTPHSHANPLVGLNFERKFARVVINLTTTSGADLRGTTAVLNGVYTTADCDLAGTGSGQVTPSQPGSITAYRSSNAAAAVTLQAIVVPQTNASDPKASARQLTFTIAGKDYTIGIPEEYAPGTSYTYNLTFDNVDVVLVGTTVSPWLEDTAAPNMNYQVAINTSANPLHLPIDGKAQTVTLRVRNAIFDPVISTHEDAEGNTAAPNWISVSSLTPEDPDGDWKVYSLSVAATSANNGTSPRYAYIRAVVDGLTTTITIIQAAPAVAVIPTVVDYDSNCYMVVPGEALTFPVTRAYVANTELSGYTGTFSTAILWDDNTVLHYTSVYGAGDAAKITVQATSNHGNALMALLRDDTGEIVWSWHIWVTDYKPDPTKHRGFMDRNLGATTNTPNTVTTLGLLYISERKDPFPASSRVGANIEYDWWSVRSSSGVANTIKDPTVYSAGISGSWNGASKTVYDPCPEGYRVPASDFYNMDRTTGEWEPQITNGGLLSEPHGGYYPAAGARDPNGGNLINIGQGWYWVRTGLLIFRYYKGQQQLSIDRRDSVRRGCAIRCITE